MKKPTRVLQFFFSLYLKKLFFTLDISTHTQQYLGAEE